MSEILDRIDTALATIPSLRSGLPAYAALIDAFEKHAARDAEQAAETLTEEMVEIAAGTYRDSTRGETELLRFFDGANMCLFDLKHQRTVMMWGVSKPVAPNSRDVGYHAGYPRAGDGYDKGHALSHAQGGLEGGPNYFKQKATVNRRLSPEGNVWRDIETFMAANAGLRAFVRLIYLPNNTSEKPANVEYNILTGRQQFRSVIFPN